MTKYWGELRTEMQDNLAYKFRGMGESRVRAIYFNIEKPLRETLDFDGKIGDHAHVARLLAQYFEARDFGEFEQKELDIEKAARTFCETHGLEYTKKVSEIVFRERILDMVGWPREEKIKYIIKNEARAEHEIRRLERELSGLPNTHLNARAASYIIDELEGKIGSRQIDEYDIPASTDLIIAALHKRVKKPKKAKKTRGNPNQLSIF